MIEGVAITNGIVTVRLPKPNRHCDCYKYLESTAGVNKDFLSSFMGKGEGFYTSSGKFLDRFQAWRHAKRVNQPLLCEEGRGPLFSEDLW